MKVNIRLNNNQSKFNYLILTYLPTTLVGQSSSINVISLPKKKNILPLLKRIGGG